jgi:type IV secretion system protein VirD4
MPRLKSILFLLWRFKWIWIGVLPFPVFYFWFWKNYFLLGHHNDAPILVQYASLHLVPALTILGSMLLFKLEIDKGLAVVSSMLVNSWYLYKIAPLWSGHYFNLLTKRGVDLFSLYKQWSLIMDMDGFWSVFIIDAVQLMLIISAFWCLVRNRALIKFDSAFSSAKPKSTNFGTAKFLDAKGIKRLNDSEGIVVGAMPKEKDFTDAHKLVASIQKKGGDELIRIKADHAILVAPSGSGKNVGVIMPTLLSYPGAVFVTDIKGENYTVTRRARESKGREVIAFDPFGIAGAPKIRINPLQFLDASSKELVDDAQILVELICPANIKDGAAAFHFQSHAASLIKTVILHVVGTFPKQNRNLYSVYKILSKPLGELLELLKEVGEDYSAAGGEAANLANQFLGIEHRERSGILSSAVLAMRFAAAQAIQEATSESDFELSEMVKGNFDLFVCIPPEKLDDQKQLLRLLIGVTFIEIMRAKGNIGKHNLLMLIDEMPALGYLKQIDNIRTYGRGFGVSLLMAAQTIQDLRNTYPHTWEAFFSSQLSIFFGAAEVMTSEFIAKKLGKQTIEVSSVSQSEGVQKQFKGGGESVQSGNSTSETGRQLLMPDEIERLGDRVALAFKRGEYPIICHRINYWERKEWKGLWDGNPLHENRGG